MLKELALKYKNKNNATSVVKNKEVVYIQYNALKKFEFIKHAFSTRIGGVSEGIYASMNLGFNRGDPDEKVLNNYKIFSEAVGFDYRKIVCSVQTHTTNVKVVKDEDAGKGIIKDRDYTDIDGFITNVPGLVLATSFADCVPLYFVDPVKKAIGLSHSGWRGTVGQMGKVTVDKMKAEYGCSPKDITACIGPSICVDCYEVSEDVHTEFRKSFSEKELEQIFIDKKNGKYQLDLWEANKIILINAGLRPENIVIPDLCTCCNRDILFSHRGSDGKRGNLTAFLGIN